MPTPISREALRSRLARPDRPVLVEALGGGYFADAHLPGAINLPPGQVGRLASDVLPDLRAEIVVYGSSTGTGADAVARHLEELGYAAVAVYLGGKEDWVEHGLPVERCTVDEPSRRTATTERPQRDDSPDGLRANGTAHGSEAPLPMRYRAP